MKQSLINEIKSSSDYKDDEFIQEVAILNDNWENETYIVTQGFNFIDIIKK